MWEEAAAGRPMIEAMLNDGAAAWRIICGDDAGSDGTRRDVTSITLAPSR